MYEGQKVVSSQKWVNTRQKERIVHVFNYTAKQPGIYKFKLSTSEMTMHSIPLTVLTPVIEKPIDG